MTTSTASQITIDRTALYELVWQEPMTKIAPRFGLSDVGLAKACKRNNIPRPPAGYWAQKAVGKAPRRTPLPAIKDGEAKPITFLPDEKPKPAPMQSQSERVKDEKLKTLIAFEQQPENKITIVQNPNKLHPIVQGTKTWLAECAKPFDHRSIRPRYDGPSLTFDVSKASQPRALILMDALIKAFEKRGHKVVFERSRNQYDRDEVYFVILDEKYTMRLREKRKMIRIPESERDKVYGSRVRHEPIGLLELHLMGKFRYTQAKWTEGAKFKLEDQLNEVMIEFIVCVERDRESRRAEQERAVQARAAEIKRWEEQKARQKEEAKINELYQCIQKWEQAARIRAFVADVIATNEKRGATIEDGGEIAQYLEWALKHADKIDPLGEERKSSSSEPVNEEWARPVQPR
jgi:hypothetical protein